MKKKVFCKVVSIVLAALIVLSFSSVFASDDLFAAMTKQSENVSMSFNASFTLDKPIDFINKIIDAEDYMNNFIDADMALSDLFKSEVKCDVKCVSSNNFQTFKIYMLFVADVPVNLTDYFKSQTQLKWACWINFDVSNGNRVYTMTVKSPFDRKYTYHDLEKINPGIIDIVSGLVSPENVKEMNSKVLDIYKKYAKIDKRGNEYTLSFTDESAKNMIKDLLVFMNEEVNKNNSLFSDEDGGRYAYNMFNDAIEDIEKLKDVPILAQDGIKIKISLNKNNRVSLQSVSAKVDVNLKKYKEALYDKTKYTGDEYVAFTLKCDMSYSYGDAAVDFPTLTDENTVDFYEKYIAPYEHDDEDYGNDKWEKLDKLYRTDEDFINGRNYVVFEDNEFVFENEELYIPFNKLCENYKIDDIKNDNGKITVTVNNKFLDAKEIVLNIDSPIVTVNGTEKNLGKNVIERNGIVFVPQNFAEVLNSSVYSYMMYRENNVWSGEIVIDFLFDYEKYVESME